MSLTAGTWPTVHRSPPAAAVMLRPEFINMRLPPERDLKRSILALVAGCLTRVGSPERTRRVFDEYNAIYWAIAQRDMQGAELAMRDHLDRLRQRVTDSRKDR